MLDNFALAFIHSVETEFKNGFVLLLAFAPRFLNSENRKTIFLILCTGVQSCLYIIYAGNSC